MAAQQWIKLYKTILDDYVFGTLSPRLAWRTIQLMLISAKIACDPEFQLTRETLCEFCGTDWDELQADMQALGLHGILSEHIVGWGNKRNVLSWKFSEQAQSWFAIGMARGATSEWAELRQIVLSRDSNTCQYCGAAAEHVDHIIPVCQGGTDDLENLVAACASCNCSKGGRTPKEAGMTLVETGNAIT